MLIFLTCTFFSKIIIHNMCGMEWKGCDSKCFIYVNLIVPDKLMLGEVQ